MYVAIKKHFYLDPINHFLHVFLSSHVVRSYSSVDMIDNVLVTVNFLGRCMLTLISLNEILLLWYVKWSTNFRGLHLDLICLLFIYNTCSQFYSCPCGDQCLLLLALDFAVGIWLEQVYLWEVQDHTLSLTCMNKYAVNASPCESLRNMLKKSASLSDDQTFVFLFVKHHYSDEMLF